MAANVFGTPVTKSTLEGMADYNRKEITQLDLAREAYLLKNADNKLADSNDYLDKLQTDFGTGLSTKCLIYNATGGPIYYSESHDYSGCLWKSGYPTEIANGQWAGFFHISKPGEYMGSSGAVVYYQNIKCFLISWSTAWGSRDNNRCYADIKTSYGEFDWDKVRSEMRIAGQQHFKAPLRSSMYEEQASLTIVTNDTNSELEAVLTYNT